jgi:V/A-type H+/Na+-transporting ATPase subunit D
MSLETTAPTRMNLLSRRSQIKLASDGAGLLQGKREALLKELLARARELRDLRREMHRRGRVAVAALAIARAVRGTPEVRSAALADRRPLRLDIRREKTWGIELYDVAATNMVRTTPERGAGMVDVSSHVLDASETAEHMVEQLVVCAPLERNLQILGQEVRNVSRRINAIEERLLPRLRQDVRTIGRVLEEREREDVFRLKRIKKKKAAARSKGGRSE